MARHLTTVLMVEHGFSDGYDGQTPDGGYDGQYLTVMMVRYPDHGYDDECLTAVMMARYLTAVMMAIPDDGFDDPNVDAVLMVRHLATVLTYPIGRPIKIPKLKIGKF